MRNIRNTNVAVIGGAGFLGSHLVDYLINERDCKVLVVDNLCAGKREFINPKARFYHHDITLSEEFLRSLFARERIRFVFNYSAWPYIPDSFARPLQVFAVNATGALHVINAAQEAGCEAILQVSSAEIYGNASELLGMMGTTEYTGTKIGEHYPVIPHSSYGAAKAAIDAMVQVRWREAKTPCIALRQFNCLGERDVLHPYVIPAIVTQLEAKRGAFQSSHASVKLGNNSSRDFMYAGDAVASAVELLEKGIFGEVYNLGSEEAIRIYDLAKLIGRLMGFSEVVIEEDESRKRPWEIWHLQSDNSKINSVIDYRPKVGLEEALKRTINDLVRRGV